MATTTQDWGLTRAEGTDNVNVLTAISNNMTAVDTDLTILAKSIGRTIWGKQCDTTAAIGQYVVLIKSTISGKTDGLYKAAKAIPANTNLDGTYLTAVTGGLGNEVNSLNSSVSTLNSNIATRLRYLTIGGISSSGTASRVINTTASSRFVVFGIGSSTYAVILCNVTSANMPKSNIVINSGPSITVAEETGKLTISSTASGVVSLYALVFEGDISV